MGAANWYTLGVALVVIVTAVYWTRPWRRALLTGRPRSASLLLALIASGLGLCLWSVMLDRPEHVLERQPRPLAIAIAFDLSPSMQAVPNPEFDGVAPPRFERAKETLSAFLRALEEWRQPVVVAVVGFTRDAEVIMGWDQSYAQVQDILEYAIAPDLFGSAGTSIEAAVHALNGAFRMLPEDLLRSSRQLAVVVSDGEDTMRASSFDYATTRVTDAGFDVIALQVGLLDRNEGLPLYGSVGEFDGFRSLRGKQFTVPDVAAMTAIADAPAGRGLYVRAETPSAVERMLHFAVEGDFGTRTPDAAWLSTFGMFSVVAMLCLVIIR